MNDRNYVHEALTYAKRVVAGEIPVCSWVRLACERQLSDLKRQGKEGFPYRFNPLLTDADGKEYRPAERVCRFIELCPHIEGRWPTKTIHLELWQCFFLTTIFGWVDQNGFRRFRKALIVVPRKSTKTTIAATIGLFLLGADGEPGARVYSAATTRDQAKLSWLAGKKMVERTRAMQQHYGMTPLAHSITIEHEAAFFQPLSRDVDSLEGLNVHGAIIDELHAHKTREVFDVLDEATGARSQPLLFIISTEGDNATGVFAEQVNYAQLVLNGQHQDDSYFSVIYTIDKEDDWTLESSWRKANPHIDVVDARGRSVLLEDLRARFRQAQKNPESQSSFLTKRLNVRVGAGEAYFPMLAWDSKCQDPALRIEDFYGQPCYVAIDLASKSDIAAKMLLFTRGPKYYVFSTHYLPEERLEAGHPMYDVYRGWTPDHLTLTPGDIIDYEFIERDLLEDMKNFEVLEVAVDPWNATQFCTRMNALGLPIQEYPQTVRSMSDPMKETAALILAGRIQHNGDPALRWMIGNVTAKIDAKENVYPRKARNENKIDAAVTLIVCVGRAMSDKPQVSIYNQLAASGGAVI